MTSAGIPKSAIRIPQSAIPPQFFGVILFADDEELIRDLGRDAFERMGFTVLTAADGREAVEVYQARAAEIDLVLLDLSMPRMDGAEALAALRGLNPDVRVVLTSGYSREEVAARFAGLGLAGVLQKPFTMVALRETMAALMPARDQ
jgi:CheY-like chemotaxis protein